MSNRYTAVAKFVGARVNVVVTDTQPMCKGDRTVTSWTTVQNIDGSNRFMLDGDGWTFLPTHNEAFMTALREAAAPLFALEYTVSVRAQTLASLRHMIVRQIGFVRNAPGEATKAHCVKVLREYLGIRSRQMAA
jgi:hypothetical protein